MSTEQTSPLPITPAEVPHRHRFVLGIAATALVIAAIMAAAAAGVVHFVDQERARELRAWQTRLAIVADSRAGAVSQWFFERVAGELGELAANESLQIYMTELALGGNAGVTAANAQMGYLQNLLLVTAERGGFNLPPSGPKVPANVRQVGVAGISLYTLDGRALVATPGMPPLEGALRAFFASLAPGSGKILDLYRNERGGVNIGFAAPVYRIQGDGEPSAQLGWIMGVKPVGDELFSLIAQPGETNATAENILVRHRPPQIEYLSPLSDDSAPLARSFADSTQGLAAAMAVAQPGGFVTARDYNEREVLAVSRPVTGLPWLLISKVERTEALGETERRLRRFLIVALLALALAFALTVALWRHGASRRAALAARRYADMARRFAAQGDFLRLVTDSQPNAILIADADGRVSFANEAAALRAGVAPEDMSGKGLAALLGPAEAKPRLALIAQALDHGAKASQTLIGADGRVIHSTHVPLPPEGDRGGPAVLMVESDVTEAVTERARRERTLNQLVGTLMAVVDNRDPYAGRQSERTSRLARAVAEEMQLDAATVRTAEIAGNLMTLGKILVPAEVLTRSGELSADEIQQVRDSLQASAHLLAGIEFDGPVVESLRQLQERWDGTGGPAGLAGEDILLPARIVAVANAFVAMVSPRAWRAGTSVDEAIEQLLREAGRSFDRRVAAALVNYLENRGGRAEWDGGAAAAG